MKSKIEKNKIIIMILIVLMIDVFMTKILLVFGTDRDIETNILIENLEGTVGLLKYSIALVLGWIIRGNDNSKL